MKCPTKPLETFFEKLKKQDEEILSVNVKNPELSKQELAMIAALKVETRYRHSLLVQYLRLLRGEELEL